MKRSFVGKRYWLVGASEGLGRALAMRLSEAGAELVLSARSVESLEALAKDLPGQSRVLPLDVSRAEAVETAVAEIDARIDGVIYLAGAYWPMQTGEWDTAKVETMIDINLTGAVRVVGAVLPPMLARGSGHIVLTGSLSAYRGLPGAVGYSASKAGLLGLAETMLCDLRGTGVDVQIVHPGFIRTRLTDKNDFKMPFIMDPEPAAARMFDIVRGDKFSGNFPWGFSLVFRLARLLPDGLYAALFGRRG